MPATANGVFLNATVMFIDAFLKSHHIQSGLRKQPGPSCVLATDLGSGEKPIASFSRPLDWTAGGAPRVKSSDDRVDV